MALDEPEKKEVKDIVKEVLKDKEATKDFVHEVVVALKRELEKEGYQRYGYRRWFAEAGPMDVNDVIDLVQRSLCLGGLMWAFPGFQRLRAMRN